MGGNWSTVCLAQRGWVLGVERCSATMDRFEDWFSLPMSRGLDSCT